MKDKFRKRRERHPFTDLVVVEEDQHKHDLSTERVKKHRESIKVKINFKKKVVTTPLRKSKERLNKTLISADQTEKVMPLKSIVTSQSPGTKKSIINEMTTTPCSSGSSSASQTSTHDINIYKTYQQLKKKRDKMSNCVKRALLKSVDVNFPKSKIRKFGASYKAFKLAKNVTFEDMIYHYKVINKRPKVIHQAVKDCIIAFYSLDHISRVVPYKNKTIKVKDAIGNHIRMQIICRQVSIAMD